jgi:hypothetical protein
LESPYHTAIPWLLGSDRFMDWVKDGFFKGKHHEEVTDSRGLAPDREKIKKEVCRFYQVKRDDLAQSMICHNHRSLSCQK